MINRSHYQYPIKKGGNVSYLPLQNITKQEEVIMFSLSIGACSHRKRIGAFTLPIHKEY